MQSKSSQESDYSPARFTVVKEAGQGAVRGCVDSREVDGSGMIDIGEVHA